MRHWKRLIAVVALVAAALGWFLWKHSAEPAALYAFDFEAFVDTDMVAFRSAVGCYPFEAKLLEKAHTVYGLRERVFSERLTSGKTFYVAVPNACSYVRSASGTYLSKGDWDRPTLETPRAIVPLTYMTDGSREPETVRLFTSLKGASEPDQPMIMLSTIQELNETDRKLHERIGESDPLARGGAWTSVVFLPISNAPRLEESWIEDRWQAGACEIARLNEQGRAAIKAFNPGGRFLELFWPQLWDGVPLTDIMLAWRLDETKAAAVREALDLVIPAVPSAQGFDIRPDRAGTVELFHANSERHKMSFRASAYFFNGIQLSQDGERNTLPFAIQCAAERRLYVPTQLAFLRKRPS